MKQNLPIDLTIETNRAVFDYIKNLSAHPDLVDPLITAVKPLEDVQRFSPDSENCRSVAVSTKGIIFGFVTGMKTIKFRLDTEAKEQALVTGGSTFLECGPGWVSFEPFVGNKPSDLEFWALKAYDYARETAP